MKYIFVSSVVLTLLFCSPTNSFDEGCVIQEVKPLGDVGVLVAFIYDASKLMEPFRLELNRTFKEVFPAVEAEYKKISFNGDFRYSQYSVTNGCTTEYSISYRGFFASVNPDLEYLRQLHTGFSRIKTEQNAQTGIENVLSGLHYSARNNIWDSSARNICNDKKKVGCHYHYIVLFTASSSSFNVPYCTNKDPPNLESIKELLHKFDRVVRVIGIFPNNSLIPDYQNIAKQLDVPFCGKSLEDNVDNVKKIPYMLADCMYYDATKDTRTYVDRPCVWEDPIGYNTLGL